MLTLRLNISVYHYLEGVESFMEIRETSWGQERGRHLLKVSTVASRMVAERIKLQNLNLSLESVPLCTEDEAVYIEELLPRAKEGFALSLKAENISASELIDLYDFTIPRTTTGIWKNITLTERQNTLPEYGHVLSSLALLLKLGKVSYFDFSNPPTEVDYSTSEVVSFWTYPHETAGQIWELLEEIETAIRKTLYQNTPLKTNELIKIGHFFTAGKEISKIFEI